MLRTLPIFPASEVKTGAYATGGSTGENLLTGFKVSPGTTVDDVVSFFAKELPLAGWQQEAEPSTESGDKGGSTYQTVIWTFVKDDVRLAIVMPLYSKDASPGVLTTVELELAPKEIQLFGSPAESAIPTGSSVPSDAKTPQVVSPTEAPTPLPTR
jgi:hypothetical protein